MDAGFSQLPEVEVSRNLQVHICNPERVAADESCWSPPAGVHLLESTCWSRPAGVHPLESTRWSPPGGVRRLRLCDGPLQSQQQFP
ncbi:uncharacterized protein V6R79_016673 [Siganus canaliculatus]